MTPASAIPHGTKRSYQERSTSQLSAKPCMVTPRLTRMPIAAILRSGRPVAGLQPDAAAAGDASRGDAEVAADRDQRLLEAAHVVDDEHVVGQRHDRVADQLAGAVEGDLAAAVDLDHRGAVGGALVRLGALAGGVDGGVLEQQHRVGPARDDLGVDRALAVPGLQVVGRAVGELLEDQFVHPSRLSRAEMACGQPPRLPRDRRQGEGMRVLVVLLLVVALAGPAAPAVGADRRPAAVPTVSSRRSRCCTSGTSGVPVAWARSDERALRSLYVPGSAAARADVRAAPLLHGPRARRTTHGDAGLRRPGAASTIRSGWSLRVLRPGRRRRGRRRPAEVAAAQQPARRTPHRAPAGGAGTWRLVAGGSPAGAESPSRSTAPTSGSRCTKPLSSRRFGTQLTEPSSSLAIGPAAGRSTNAGHPEEGRPVHLVAPARG